MYITYQQHCLKEILNNSFQAVQILDGLEMDIVMMLQIMSNVALIMETVVD